MSIKVQFLPVGLYILLYVILFYSQPSKAPAGRSNTYIPTMDYFYKTLLFVTLTVVASAETCATDGSSAKVSTSSITLGKSTRKVVLMVLFSLLHLTVLMLGCTFCRLIHSRHSYSIFGMPTMGLEWSDHPWHCTGD